MTVYVEYVFIDNFVIDLFLFKTAFAVTGKSVSRLRLIVCSLLGAAFALLYPLITANGVIITAAKIVFGLFLTFCSAKFSSAKDYATFTAVFIGLTFFVGGIIVGAFSVLGLDASSEYSVALMVLPVWLALSAVKRLIRYFYRAKDISGLKTSVEIVCGDNVVKLKGFFDTGNALYDGLSPVIIVSKRKIAPVLSVTAIKNAKYFNIKTAVGEDKKICFKPDSVAIYSGGGKHIFYNVRVCVVNTEFSGYDVILHPALMEEKDEIQIAC